MKGVLNKILMGSAFMALLIAFSYCSSTQVEPEVEELSFFPISEDWKAKKKTSSSGLSEFGCTLSTRTKDGAEYDFKYQGFELAIPERIIDESEGKVKVASFRVTHPDVQKENVDDIVAEDYVRIVDCKIPDHPEMIDLIENELTKFGTDTWAVNGNPNAKRKSSSGDWVQTCTWELTGVSYTIVNGEIVAWNYYYSQVCTWEFVEDDDPFGGGGGGMGGGGDPDPPCEPWDICEDDGGGDHKYH